MSHRATLYSVRIHPRRKPDDLRPFGDFDESGTALTTAINGYFQATGFKSENDAGTRTVVCEKSAVVGDEVRSLFSNGQSGLVADIVDANGQLRIRQEPSDSQLLRCASLFRLEPNEMTGWWAVHVNNGRSAKGLVQKKLIELFRNGYENLTLKIAPVVRGGDLAEAVRQGRIDSVSLLRLERPTDRSTQAGAGKWVRADEDAKLELHIKGPHRLKSRLVDRYLRGEHSLFGEIVEFEGMKFDKARVEVELRNGVHRTFNIEELEAGHAFSVDLDNLDLANDGEPTEDSLYSELGRAIDELT